MMWQVNTVEKEIYLTFDDGPIPEVTEWVLLELAKWEAKATFFVVGENVKKYPDIYNQLSWSEHAIGNHTYNHLNGWKSNTAAYLDNVNLCSQAISNAPSGLFRPPYGKITLEQAKKVANTHKIIMWDVLSGDFDVSQSPAECLKRTIEATRNGSVVVFHDNIKTTDTLKIVLPAYLEHFSHLGYQFKALTS